MREILLLIPYLGEIYGFLRTGLKICVNFGPLSIPYVCKMSYNRLAKPNKLAGSGEPSHCKRDEKGNSGPEFTRKNTISYVSN